jgi:hypothetical protein
MEAKERYTDILPKLQKPILEQATDAEKIVNFKHWALHGQRAKKEE